MKPTLLKNLRIHTLGSVDTPANQHGKAVLFKRAVEDEVKELQQALEQEPKNLLDKIGKAVSAALASVLQPEQLVNKAAKDLFTALHEEWIDNFVWDVLWDINYAFRESVESILKDSTLEDKKSSVEAVAAQYVSVLEQHGVFENYGVVKNSEGKIDVEQVLKSFGTKEDIPEDIKQVISEIDITKTATEEEPDMGQNHESGSVEAILKNTENLPPEVVEALKKSADMEKQLKAAQDAIELEKNARLDREYLAKAASYTHLPEKGEDFATILKGLGTKAPEEFARIEAVLKAANDIISKSKLFEEVGKGGTPTPTSAWEEVEKRATEMVSKNASMTKEQAIDAVLTSDADLYTRYRRGE